MTSVEPLQVASASLARQIPTPVLAVFRGIGQVFFIGDGLTGTGSGAIQTFAVPDAATRLFLGVADAFAFGSDLPGGRDPGFFDDNSGQRTGFPGLYMEQATCLTFKPCPGFIIRPELRFDYNEKSRPFENHKGLATGTVDFIIRY